MNPIEAKKYFIEKIVRQAQTEGRPLDELEVTMLHFTETGTDACPEYLEASARFDAERDTEEFETRVAELVRRACAKEVESAKADGREAEFSGTLQQAYAALQQEDHYILVMIDQAK